MDVYYMIVLFLFGTILGSFFNVVGDRVPVGQSIVTPSSHCPKCQHKLSALELIPIFSYLLQGGKCKNCKSKIPIMHPLFEFACGLLFALAYYVFRLTPDLVIALTFISMLMIIFVSDYQYMIIPDEVLIIGGILLFLEVLCFRGIQPFFSSIFSGILAFGVMYLLKLFGDFVFQKESMGGGDIKLMFFFGFVLGFPMTLLSIVLGSFIGLPLSLIQLHKNASHVVPFGPMLSAGALIVLFTKLDISKIIAWFS